MRRQAFVLVGVYLMFGLAQSANHRSESGDSGGTVRQDGVGMEMCGTEPRACRAGRRLPQSHVCRPADQVHGDQG